MRSGSKRGLVVADDAKYEKSIQPLANLWRSEGGRIAKLTRLAKVPLFAESKSSRLLQGADFVAHALYRYDEAVIRVSSDRSCLLLTPPVASCTGSATSSRHTGNAHMSGLCEQGDGGAKSAAVKGPCPSRRWPG